MTRQQAGQYAALCKKCYSMGIPKPDRPNTAPKGIETQTPGAPFLAIAEKPARVTISEEKLKTLFDMAQENYRKALVRLAEVRSFDRFNQLIYFDAKEEAEKAERLVDELWLIHLHGH